ncbi:MAG TPA: 8-amino-7-oxononanoate synthase [Tetrasphaera sp.]|uniref:8-amino-7-oxononanoate synthase n=1 Tax=Nostocoides sp. TaxID=1917966 RepID=UPI002C54808F|nr:8-amino-7-oxononanoate synthase [Tetrasphaera sp.]HNQ07418.1 8-amino-7-oxononanoate synthase [Tetrasphaera sp.]
MNGSMGAFLATRAAWRDERGIRRATTVRDGAVDLASNDYLGLARDPRVVRAGHTALDRYGAGARASRVVTGTTTAHEELEAEICSLTGASSALVFSSGFAANVGAITALGGPDLLLVLDAHVHASIHDAARLSKSVVSFVPHGDVDAVRSALAGRTEGRALVVVESVYSVLGDVADLAALAAVCADHDATLLVDEAHGIGVLGAGRGGVHAAGLAGADHVLVTATMSKALGAQGGAVLGPSALREHLVNTARTFIFDTGLTPAAAASASQACRIIAADSALVGRLHANADVIAQECGIARAAGPVQSIPCPSAEVARVAADRAGERGVLVGCFRPPSVPDGISRVRLTACAGLGLDEVRAAAEIVGAEFAAACAAEGTDSAPSARSGGAGHGLGSEPTATPTQSRQRAPGARR